MPLSLKPAEPLTPRIALTMGDPCGVGPEILVKVLRQGIRPEGCSLIVVGDPSALRRASRLLLQPLSFRLVEDMAQLHPEEAPDAVVVLAPVALEERDMEYGRPTERTCRAVIRYIQCAAELALQGRVDAICTCPINKAHLHRHGFAFPGHTEFLQELTNTEEVVMMLAGPRLRVALVTIHEPLSNVPQLITGERIRRTIAITGEALQRDFGILNPRIAVAGLNPHAGEEGRFGREEIERVRPIVESFAESPFQLVGPLPPDTVFHRAYQGEFDVVVAMYHDQGLIPVKLVHFDEAVNVTLGMPIVRTSVDHGTAYDLAGRGIAREGSLRAAIACAAAMAGNRLRAQISSR